MDIPVQAVELVRKFEGLRLKPYYDAVGFPTIGYGSLLSRKRNDDLNKYPSITQEEAENILTSDLTKAAESVVRLCPRNLTEGQFAALIDFTFNLGAGNLQSSTLRMKVNRGDFSEAAGEFGKWIWAGGVKLPGLVRRRAAEVEIFRG